MSVFKLPQGFPLKQFRVFALFGALVTIIAFLPPPFDRLGSVRLFFMRITGNLPAVKGAPPPQITDITADIHDLEEALQRPPVSSTQNATTPLPVPPKSTRPPVKSGALQEIRGGKFLRNPCLTGGNHGCSEWALSSFYEALSRTAQKKSVTRISYFGDSIIALDKVTSTVRSKFQKRFGNSGPGFFHMAPIWKWNRHEQISLFEKEWQTDTMLKPKRKLRYYGYGGVLARTIGPGAATVLRIRDGAETAVDTMTVFYVKNSEGGHFHIKVDGTILKRVNTRGPSKNGDAVTVHFKGGSSFAVEAGKGGVLWLTGIVLEKRTPGVVLDSLSLTGGRLIHFANNDAAHMSATIRQRNPNLLIFHFGINEADTGIEPEYQEKVGAFLSSLRKAKPNLSCLVMGPSDKVKKKWGSYITRPIIHYIIKVQRELAYKAGCAFFNTWEAMGGEASIVRWYNHKPRLAIGDFTHITPAGGDLLGSLIYLELMKGYQQWLREGR